MVVALLALFIALGGSAYAVQKIGTKQIKNGAVTAPKLKNGAVTNAKVAAGSLGADRLTPAARREMGPIAYATINTDGTVFPERTLGISNGDFTHPSTGVYCMANVPPGTRTVMASPSSIYYPPEQGDAIVSVGFRTNSAEDPGWSGCPGYADDLRVSILRPAIGLADRTFTIWFDD